MIKLASELSIGDTVAWFASCGPLSGKVLGIVEGKNARNELIDWVEIQVNPIGNRLSQKIRIALYASTMFRLMVVEK